MSRSYQIFTEMHYAYFVTWTLVEWVHLLDREPYLYIILDSLNYLRTEKKTQLNAFVIMSSHIHAILWPEIGINLSDVQGTSSALHLVKSPKKPKIKMK